MTLTASRLTSTRANEQFTGGPAAYWREHQRTPRQRIRRRRGSDGVLAARRPAPRSALVGVTAALRSLTCAPRESAPTLVAEPFDASVVIERVWPGRPRIADVEPGRVVLVEGCVSVPVGNLAIYNPPDRRRETG